MGQGRGLLRNRDFMLILFGQVVSLMGAAVQRVCVALYLLEVTGSSATYAAVLAASTLPYVLCAPLAGALADSFNRRDIMVALDAGCAVLMAAFCAALSCGEVSVAPACVVSVLLAVAGALYGPAVSACVPQLVPPDARPRANSAVSLVSSLSNTAGPVLAGVLYGLAGIRCTALLYAGCLVLSAALESRVRLPGVRRASPSLRAVFGAVALARSAKATFGELRRSYPAVLGVIMCYGMLNLFVLPINTVLLPSVLMLDLGVSSEVYGLVEGVVASGMAVGTALVGALPGRFRFAGHWRWLAAIPPLVLAMAGSLACAPLLGETAVSAALAACAMGVMLCLGVTNVVTLTYNQGAVPAEMLGRLSAFSTAFATSTVPLGQLVVGGALDAGAGAVPVLACCSALAAAVCAFARRNARRATAGAR